MTGKRWLQLALAVSMALNLLVAGAIIGRMRNPEPPLGWAVKQLDAETRQRLRPVMRRQVTNTARARRELRQLQVEIRDLMAEEALDRDRLSATLARMRALGADYQESLHEGAIDVLAELTPEQRLRVARRLLRPGPDPATTRVKERRPPPR